MIIFHFFLRVLRKRCPAFFSEVCIPQFGSLRRSSQKRISSKKKICWAPDNTTERLCTTFFLRCIPQFWELKAPPSLKNAFRAKQNMLRASDNTIEVCTTFSLRCIPQFGSLRHPSQKLTSSKKKKLLGTEYYDRGVHNFFF